MMVVAVKRALARATSQGGQTNAKGNQPQSEEDDVPL